MARDNTVYAASTGGNYSSYGNLLNPVSQMLGGGDRYPEFMASLLPGNPETAWMLSKLGAIGLLAASLAGSVRAVQHLDRVRGLKDTDKPAEGLKSQISTTFDVSLSPTRTGQAKKAAKVKVPQAGYPKQSLSLAMPGDVWTNTVRTGVPLGVALLSAVAAWKGADYIADKRKNKVLAQMIQQKNETVKKLMQTRARVAKGLSEDKEVRAVLGADDQALDAYVKTAGATASDSVAPKAPGMFMRPIITGMPLLLLALATSGAVGSYKYFSRTHENNIRYSALKRGLAEYARSKANMTPVNLIPADAESYFKTLDAEPKKKIPREEPELLPMNQPVQVTF